MASLEVYEEGVEAARHEVADGPIVRRLLDRGLDRRDLMAFLLHYCGLGVQMTRPVEGWIRAAGQRCIALGWTELGDSLVRHAKQEAGHDQYFSEDTRWLADFWNVEYEPTVDATEFLAMPPSPAVTAYVVLHEATISSDAPYGQLAIEYEIERLSTVLGPPFIGRVADACGPDVARSLSFVNSHVAVDVGHTEFNRRQLSSFLETKPDAAEPMAMIGTRAIDCYLSFIDDCFELASKMTAATAP
jgi:hypothetical protein